MSGNPGAAFLAPRTPFSSPRSAAYFLPVKQMRSLNTMIWIVTLSTILNTVSNPFPSQEKPGEAVTQLCLWVTQHDAPLLSGDSTLPLASIGNKLRLCLVGSDLSEMSGPQTLAVPRWHHERCPQPAAPDPSRVFGSGVKPESFVFPGMGRLPGPTPALCKYMASQAQVAIFEQVTRNNSCTCKLKFCLKITLCLRSLKPGGSTAAAIKFHFTRLFPAVMVSLGPHPAFLHFKALFSCKYLPF